MVKEIIAARHVDRLIFGGSAAFVLELAASWAETLRIEPSRKTIAKQMEWITRSLI